MNPIGLILVILLIVILLGAWPTWGWHNYGYVPSGGLGLVLIVLLVLLLLGRL